MLERSPSPDDPRQRWFEHATPEQKHAAVHVLLSVAASDGKMVAEEKNVIAEACTRMGVSAIEVAEALVSGMPEAIDPPESRGGRLQLLIDAAAVMVADRRVDDRELAVLLTIGQSLGFTREEVGEIAIRVIQAMQRQEQRAEVLRRLIGGEPQ